MLKSSGDSGRSYMKEPLCPKCSSRYVHFNKKHKKWICEDCECEFDYLEDKDPFEILDIDNESLWCKELWEYAPTPLAESYFQLYRYVNEKNMGSTLFLIRDVFELFIKIPVSILFNGLHELYTLNGQHFCSILNTSIKVRKLYTYSMQILVTGKWWECVRLASELDEDLVEKLFHDTCVPMLYQETIRYLKKIYGKMYFHVPGKSKINMVTWRNRVVGHSCLAYDVDERKIEIPYILEMFRIVGEISVVYYKRVWFENYEKKPLRGITVNDIDEELYIRYSNSLESEQSSTIIVHNFISGKKHNFALYDGYEKGKAYLLNYGNGERYLDIRLSDFILKHHEMLNKISSDFMLSENDVFEDNLESSDMEQMEKLLSNNGEIISIDFLYQWLINAISNSEKGNFLLTAEQGMGKSIFCSTLDQLDDVVSMDIDESIIDDWSNFVENTAIRVWHFNSSYNGRKEIYIQGIRDAIMTLAPSMYVDNKLINANILKGRLNLQWNELLSCDEELRPAYFAECLNQALKEYRERTGKAKLLLVLDGIDEVTNVQELFSFLPESGEVNEGIYMLLTSRTLPELQSKPDLCIELNKHSFREKLIFMRTSIEIERDKQIIHKESSNCGYKDAVERYIRSIIQEDKKVLSVVGKISKSFEYRFSLISAYGKLCKINPVFAESQDIDLFGIFIRRLEMNTPDIYVNEVRNILNIMRWSSEPLTLREIAYLSGECYVSYRLLEILCDLSAFVKVMRSSNGNKYGISHIQWEEKIADWYPEGEITFLNKCIALFSEIETYFTNNGIERILQSCYEGEVWLLKNIFDIAENIKGKVNKGLKEISLERIELMFLRLLRSEAFLERICNDLYCTETYGDLWIFSLPYKYVKYLKNNETVKGMDSHDKFCSEYLLLNEVSFFYDKMFDFFNTKLQNFDESSLNNEFFMDDNADRRKIEEKISIILYHLGELCVQHASLVGDNKKNELFEKAKKSYEKVKELCIFGLWSNKIKVQYAKILIDENKYYEACWQCVRVIDGYDLIHERYSLEERLVLVQAYTFFSLSRQNFKEIFPFTDNMEARKSLDIGYSIICDMVKESNNNNIYLSWKKHIEKLLKEVVEC